MFERPEIRMHYRDFQRLVNDFCLSDRDFQAYDSNKLDHIFRYYFKDLKEWKYSGFKDPEVIFKGPPNFDGDSSAYRYIAQRDAKRLGCEVKMLGDGLL